MQVVLIEGLKHVDIIFVSFHLALVMVDLYEGERLIASLDGEDQEGIAAKKRPISFGMDDIKQGLVYEVIIRLGIHMDDLRAQFRLDNEGSLRREICV